MKIRNQAQALWKFGIDEFKQKLETGVWKLEKLNWIWKMKMKNQRTQIRLIFRKFSFQFFLSSFFFLLCNSPVYAQSCGESLPLEADFTQEELLSSADWIMEIAIAPDGKIYYVEREGPVKVYDPGTLQATELINLDVFTLVSQGSIRAAGLTGIGLDPGFMNNGFLYVYYMEPLTQEEWEAQQTIAHLSRFTVSGNSIDPASEVRMITIPLDNADHQGGSITFDPQGNLYLTTGDDIWAGGYQQYAPNDWTGTADLPDGKCPQQGPDPCFRDAGRSTANTNDLRGKVLRITPQQDGSYTIPQGNLFPQTDSTRGEIYTMGHRIPYRISIDKKRGWLMIGEGGPANGTGGDRGPTGHEELNIARGPGFFGWPMFNGHGDRGFRPWDHAGGGPDVTVNGGEAWMIDEPVYNMSPRNTGARLMPAPVKPAIAFDKGSTSMTHEYFQGYGGCVPVAGPVYYYGNYDGGGKQLPPYYDGKLIFTDVRPKQIGISAATLDEEGNVTAIEKMPTLHEIEETLDLELGSDGALYVAAGKTITAYKWAGCELPVVGVLKDVKSNLGFFGDNFLSNANKQKSFDVYTLKGTRVADYNHIEGTLEFTRESRNIKDQVLVVKYR